MAAADSQAKTKITLTGAQETLLATLYAKWYDSKRPKPILGDKWAGYVLDRLDYDFAALGIDPITAQSLALRTRGLDRWTAEFLDDHCGSSGDGPGATVVSLACGLDARTLRLGRYFGAPPAPPVRWVDVDLPDVVALRRRVLPEPSLSSGGGMGTGSSYELVSGSAAPASEAGWAWLSTIPTDRPAVVVFEGLSMYLSEEEGRALIGRVLEHFGEHGGQVLFDCLGWFGLVAQRWMALTRRTGASWRWALDDPRALEAWGPGPSGGGVQGRRLKLLDDVLICERPGNAELPFVGRLQMWVVAWVPGMRYVGRELRYQF